VKDLFDIWYLSSRVEALSEFFFEYFPYSRIAQLDAWYRSFSRQKTKLELIDLVEDVDPDGVFRHLDEEIFKKTPDKLL